MNTQEHTLAWEVRLLRSAGGTGSRFRLNKSEEIEIVRLYKEGVGLSRLGKQFKCSYDTIRYCLLRNGIVPPKGPRRALGEDAKVAIAKAYEEGESIERLAKIHGCSTSPIMKALDEHGISRRDYHNRDLHRTHFNRYRVIPASVYCNKRHSALRNHIVWEITIEDIQAAYDTQNKLCYYTGLPLKTAGHDVDYKALVKDDPLALSIDRRDSSKGYTKDNIVLCCRFINYAKNSYPEGVFKQALSQAVQSLMPIVKAGLREDTEDFLACPA